MVGLPSPWTARRIVTRATPAATPPAPRPNLIGSDAVRGYLGWTSGDPDCRGAARQKFPARMAETVRILNLPREV